MKSIKGPFGNKTFRKTEEDLSKRTIEDLHASISDWENIPSATLSDILAELMRRAINKNDSDL